MYSFDQTGSTASAYEAHSDGEVSYEHLMMSSSRYEVFRSTTEIQIAIKLVEGGIRILQMD